MFSGKESTRDVVSIPALGRSPGGIQTPWIPLLEIASHPLPSFLSLLASHPQPYCLGVFLAATCLKSPLFPYTMLFRSDRDWVWELLGLAWEERAQALLMGSEYTGASETPCLGEIGRAHV